MKLAGKNIILTGASRGFGRYLANVLWEEGANLLLIARGVHKVFSQLPGREGQMNNLLSVDLSIYDAKYKILSRARQLWPHIDGLVNNAAVQGPIGVAWENDWDQWLHALDVNLLAPISLCRAIAPEMLKHGKGKIVNLSGGGATSARPNLSAYATSKAGLVRFSECLAQEFVGKNIDVNCVAPGKMPTAMLPEGETADKDAMQKAAELVVFLLSDESDGITGRLISAIWDDWRHLDMQTLNEDAYRLRRVSP